VGGVQAGSGGVWGEQGIGEEEEDGEGRTGEGGEAGRVEVFA